MSSDCLFDNPRVVLALLHCTVSQAGGRVLVRPTDDQLAFMSKEDDPDVGYLRYTVTDDGILLETEDFRPT